MINLIKIFVTVFIPIIILNIVLYLIGDNDGTGLGIGLLIPKIGSLIFCFILLQITLFKIFTKPRTRLIIIVNVLFLIGISLNIQVLKFIKSQATRALYVNEYQSAKQDLNGATFVFIEPVYSEYIKVESPLYIQIYVGKDFELLSEIPIFLRDENQQIIAQSHLRANGQYSKDGRRIFDGHLEFQIPKNNEWLEYQLSIDKIIQGDHTIPGASLFVHVL